MTDTLDRDTHTVTMTLDLSDLGILERALDLTARHTPPGEPGVRVRAMTARIQEAMTAVMLSHTPMWDYRPALTHTTQRPAPSERLHTLHYDDAGQVVSGAPDFEGDDG